MVSFNDLRLFDHFYDTSQSLRKLEESSVFFFILPTMNVSDIASDQEEKYLHFVIRAQRAKTHEPSGLTPNGLCHWCYDEIALPKLYCDEKCAKKHGTRLKLHKGL